MEREREREREGGERERGERGRKNRVKVPFGFVTCCSSTRSDPFGFSSSCDDQQRTIEVHWLTLSTDSISLHSSTCIRTHIDTSMLLY